jgi:hypothetical protein
VFQGTSSRRSWMLSFSSIWLRSSCWNFVFTMCCFIYICALCVSS